MGRHEEVIPVCLGWPLSKEPQELARTGEKLGMMSTGSEQFEVRPPSGQRRRFRSR